MVNNHLTLRVEPKNKCGYVCQTVLVTTLAEETLTIVCVHRYDHP